MYLFCNGTEMGVPLLSCLISIKTYLKHRVSLFKPNQHVDNSKSLKLTQNNQFVVSFLEREGMCEFCPLPLPNCYKYN